MERALTFFLAFQSFIPDFCYSNPLYVMILASANGLLTSLMFETAILARQMKIEDALRTAANMR